MTLAEACETDLERSTTSVELASFGYVYEGKIPLSKSDALSIGYVTAFWIYAVKDYGSITFVFTEVSISLSCYAGLS